MRLAERTRERGGDRSVIRRWKSAAPYFLTALRIVAAFLFIQHGTIKLFAFPGPAMPGMGAVPVASLAGIAGVLETVGGMLLLLGLFTRPVAFLLSGEMAVAYFYQHAPLGFWPALNQGELAALFCFIWLYISAAGPGRLSLDRWWRERRADYTTAPAVPTWILVPGRGTPTRSRIVGNGHAR